MIHATPIIDRRLAARLGELDALRAALRVQVGDAGRYIGALRRQFRASTIGSSVAIEGYVVPEAERESVIRHGSGLPGDDDRAALACYAHAMDHVAVLAGDPHFAWSKRVILDLHFDASSFQRDRDPGRYRRTGVHIDGPDGGAPVFVGPPADDVAALMEEAVAWLREGDLDAHVVVRGAMAHLHLASIHPFRDGNGRVARIVQSLVLAREGSLAAPELISIEEHLGRHTEAYYAALREAQGGGHHPARDASGWVRFCVEAHVEEARRRLSQIDAAARRWAFLESLVAERGWPERAVIALEQALAHGVDRLGYAEEAEVSMASASGDLRRILDAGLVVQTGRGRSTRYLASEALRESLRRHLAGD